MPFFFVLAIELSMALLKVLNFRLGGRIVKGRQEKEKHVPQYPTLSIQGFYLELCPFQPQKPYSIMG